jgi:asparagine synthase (glutamine-hydrolysing)
MCSILGIFDLAPGDDPAPFARRRWPAPPGSGTGAPTGAGCSWARGDPRPRAAGHRGSGGGAQPIVAADGSLVLAVNGEIYNHRELRAGLDAEARGAGRGAVGYQTGSDCEVILPLWRAHGRRGARAAERDLRLRDPRARHRTVGRGPGPGGGHSPLLGADERGTLLGGLGAQGPGGPVSRARGLPSGAWSSTAPGELRPFRPPALAEPTGAVPGGARPASPRSSARRWRTRSTGSS